MIGTVERPGWRILFLAAPLLVFLSVFYGYPIAAMLARSFVGDGGLSLQHYAAFFEGSAYAQAFIYTVQLGLGVVVITLCLGYPVAYLMTKTSPRITAIMMACILLPFWTSVIVRTFAWMVILGREGLLNKAIVSMGLSPTPLRLLGTQFAVYIGMSYYLLPFMVLSLFNVMKTIDPMHMHTARVLGASAPVSFLRVFLPLSMPGVISGSVLVLVLAIGFYITPAMLGNIHTTTVPMLIEAEINASGNWDVAAALAVILLIVTSLLNAVAERAGGTNKMTGLRG